MSINVIVNGAHGKMGETTQSAIEAAEDLNLVASLGRQDDLANTIKETNADVVIDFTIPKTVYENSLTIINSGARPVIGTTGLSLAQIATLTDECEKNNLGGVIAPNFSLGAILMMRYAQDAAKHLPNAEIIEMHHPAKLDAPSGTAIKTAQMMEQSHKESKITHEDEPKARGEKFHGTTIHSVRLSGLFAHQMVMFGGHGETLTIRHDATDRNSMMPGVCLACRKVMEIDHLVYGLENFL
jgi:4-hydroxy-tetrahydrodipicolinate reductase